MLRGEESSLRTIQKPRNGTSSRRWLSPSWLRYGMRMHACRVLRTVQGSGNQRGKALGPARLSDSEVGCRFLRYRTKPLTRSSQGTLCGSGRSR
jgi:hypothetical protein